MKLNVFNSERGFVLAQPGGLSTGLAQLRYGADPEAVGWVQSIHLPTAASIEILDAISRNTVALLPFAKARELGLAALIQPQSRGSQGAEMASPPKAGPAFQ